MSVPSASYSVTMRVVLDHASRIGAITTAIGDAGGTVSAFDVVESGSGMTVDMTCNAVDEGHASRG
jgi:malate dehydrogenase (oxaloacetate-decarboxylating)